MVVSHFESVVQGTQLGFNSPSNQGPLVEVVRKGLYTEVALGRDQPDEMESAVGIESIATQVNRRCLGSQGKKQEVVVVELLKGTSVPGA